MSLINVRRDVSDAFYRYKMERLQTKVEGKGNGIKTVVVNVSSVAASLARPASYIMKYFGFELGAMTRDDIKDDRWIINGAHEAGKLQDHLDGFINKFVLCKSCKNPETDIKIDNDRILLDCKACGQRTAVDLRLKLSGYILKNQPSKKNKKDKAERRAAKKAKQNGTATENGHVSGGDEGSENGSNENEENGDAVSDHEFNKLQAEAIEDAAVKVKDDEWAAKEMGIENKHRTVLVLAQTVFDKDVCVQIPKRAGMLKQIINSERHEKALLGGTERLIGSLAQSNPDFLQQIVKILQLYYHHDLISEEVVTKWGTHASKKYTDKNTSRKIRQAAKPFLEWLAEADEEESDEEEDE
ncbi:Eukaryotic translation initiation factor 5 [Metarhizium anisopliae]